MKHGLHHWSGSKQLLRIMTSQSASTYANQVIAFVIPWLVLSRTGSAFNAGLVASVMSLASLIGILTGGLVTDRIGGRKVSMIADTLSFLTAFILALMLRLDFFSLWLVIISQMIGVFFDSPGSIAKNTLVPAAAKQDQIPMVRAMGMQQTLQNLAMFLGPISAGLLVVAFGEGITLMITSALFLVCVCLIASLKDQFIMHEHPMTVQQAYTDIREAIQFLLKDPLMGPMQLFGPLYAFFLHSIAAIVIPAWFVFAGKGSESLGIFLGAQALGGMVGGFVFAALAPKVSQHKWLVGATTGYALTLLTLYFTEPGSILSIATGFSAGVVFTGIMTIPFTAFYIRTPEKLLGRVNGLGAASGFLIATPSSLFFGWLISAGSARIGILTCAIGMGLLAIGTMVLPFMRLLDEKKGEVINVSHDPDQLEYGGRKSA